MKRKAYKSGLSYILAIALTAALGLMSSHADAESIPTHYLFSGETLKIPYHWDTPNCKSVRSQLFWKQSSHTSPVGKIRFGSCSEEINWELPRVGQREHYELVIEVFSIDHWNHLETFRIRVYPRNLLDPLRDWAQKNTLMVADSVGKLEAVLKFFKIPHEKIFGFEPPSPQAIMKVGRREYVFREVATPLPKIWIKEDRVEFEMKILDNLPNHPLFQSELMEIMEEDFTVTVQPNTDALDILDKNPSGS